MSQFAAGCAVCGADLEAARARARPRVNVADHLPRVGDEAVWVGIVALVVLAMPVIGLLLAGYGIYSANLTSQGRLRVALIALAAVALVLVAVPATRYGVIWLLTA